MNTGRLRTQWRAWLIPFIALTVVVAGVAAVIYGGG